MNKMIELTIIKASDFARAIEPKIERPRRDEVKDHEYVVQTRRCLGCDNKFRSSWWGHRMCKNCR